MLEFNLSDHRLEQYETSELESEGIRERSGLQKAIANSWTEFRKEIDSPPVVLDILT